VQECNTYIIMRAVRMVVDWLTVMLREHCTGYVGECKSTAFSEEDSTDVLFLAAYEIFCSDELGAEKHLAAVRRLYEQEFRKNLWGGYRLTWKSL